MLFGYFNLCSSYTIFHKEVEKFKSITIQNGYPRNFFDKICPASTTTSVPKRIIFFTLPFTSQHSLQICEQIAKLFASAFPQIQLQVIFKPVWSLLSFFLHFKDQISLALRSPVVYKFKCQLCESLYIGETICHLHAHVSAYTGKPISFTTDWPACFFDWFFHSKILFF